MMIVTSSVEKYPTKKIKESLNTQIKELSFDGAYDYLPMPILKLVMPNGGQTFFTDSDMEVVWNTYAWQTLKSSSLYYTFDNSKSKYTIIKDFEITESTSSYIWNIKDFISKKSSDVPLPLTSSYKIIVCGSYDNTTIIDSSLREFSIVTRSIKLLDNGVNVVVSGKDNIYPISWESTGTSKYVTITGNIIKPDDTEVSFNITSSYLVPDTKTYYWNVSNSYDAGSFIITIYDSLNTSINSTSNELTMTDGFIQNVTGWKVSFPKIDSITTQGIYALQEYYIRIDKEVGEVYIPKSLIILTGIIGKIYIKPDVIFTNNKDGFIFGVKYNVN